MWMLLGVSAIVFTILNLIWSFRNKNARWFRFIALALTALTMNSFYSDGAMRVVKQDWAGLMDTMLAMNKFLFICVIASILLNSISLFREKKRLNI